MERVSSNFDFKLLEKTMFNLDADHSSTALSRIKNELNKFFIKAKCKEVLYTINTDKLFFGMKVYPLIDESKAIEILGDRENKAFDSYVIEIDSKLLDPMLYLEGDELVALLLHEVGHIVYDTASISAVKAVIDMYFAKSNEYVNLRSSKGYRELLAYAIKDSVMKAGSIFAKKFNNTEMIADAFVTACGYGPQLESAMKKIVRSLSYMAQDVDNRFIALSWVLRMANEFSIRRLPAVKTLLKAKELTGSNLEKKELAYAANVLAKMEEPVSEGFVEDLKNRFSKIAMNFKTRGIRAVKQDVYELNLKLRTAEDVSDLMSIIRSCNSSIALIQDYMTEDITDAEREDCARVLQDLYDIREKAAKDKQVKDRYSGYIQVTYPTIEA